MSEYLSRVARRNKRVLDRLTEELWRSLDRYMSNAETVDLETVKRVLTNRAAELNVNGGKREARLMPEALRIVLRKFEIVLGLALGEIEAPTNPDSTVVAFPDS